MEQKRIEFWVIVVLCVLLMLAFIWWADAFRDRANMWNECVDRCLATCMCPSEMNYTKGSPLKEGEWPFD